MGSQFKNRLESCEGGVKTTLRHLDVVGLTQLGKVEWGEWSHWCGLGVSGLLLGLVDPVHDVEASVMSRRVGCLGLFLLFILVCVRVVE